MKNQILSIVISILAPVLIIGALLYFFGDKINGLFDKGLPFTKLDETGSTISDAQTIEMANSLHQSMSMWGGTDEYTIYKIFASINTKGYFAKVYNFFGHRPYDDLFGVSSTKGLGENIDLFGWLKYELSPAEYNKLLEDNSRLF